MVQLYLELGYFAAVNLVAFALMGIDKQRAKKHLWRIPEKTLFLAVILGGGIGGTAGMFSKTLCGLRQSVRPKVQPGEILSRLRRQSSQAAENRK